MNNRAVVFDFDETLVLQNSLGLMFKCIATNNYWITAIPAVIRSVLIGQFGYRLRRNIKQALYGKYLAGVNPRDLQEAGKLAAKQLTVNVPVMNALKIAKTQGDVVIVATASPRIFVAAILDEMKVDLDKVIGTEIDLEMGQIIGEECSRQAKWNALSKELNKLRIQKTLAYGNAPDDIYMLKKVDEGFLVEGGSINKY
jgi:HAD superfamily phosphoserine phosphatase-like hydrolase